MDSINNELLTVLRSLVVALTSDQEGIHISEVGFYYYNLVQFAIYVEIYRYIDKLILSRHQKS